MSHGRAHPSSCQTIANVLYLGGSPWSWTRSRWVPEGTSSALAGNLHRGGHLHSNAVLTSPSHGLARLLRRGPRVWHLEPAHAFSQTTMVHSSSLNSCFLKSVSGDNDSDLKDNIFGDVLEGEGGGGDKQKMGTDVGSFSMPKSVLAGASDCPNMNTMVSIHFLCMCML